MIKNYSFLIKTNYLFSPSLNMTFFKTFSTSSKQKIKIKNIVAYDLETINWFSLKKSGFIIPLQKNFEKKPAIYIYQNKLNKNQIYIGSSINLIRRLEQHRYLCNKNIKSCPKFYNCVSKYGWNNFRVGILEYIGSNKVYRSTIDKVLLKRNLIEREQFYFDIFKPTLNINKIAGSTLGFKHTEETRFLMSLERKGKSINRRKQNISYIISEETKNNLSIRTRHGVIVKVVDKNNKIINTFPTITSAAKFYNTNHTTLSRYLKSEKLWKDKYYFLCKAN